MHVFHFQIGPMCSELLSMIFFVTGLSNQDLPVCERNFSPCMQLQGPAIPLPALSAGKCTYVQSQVSNIFNHTSFICLSQWIHMSWPSLDSYGFNSCLEAKNFLL